MQIEIIFTLEQGQLMGLFPFEPNIIETRESFIKFCTNALQHYRAIMPVQEYREKNLKEFIPAYKLVKLSACVYGDAETYVFPEWYERDRGKVYFENNVYEN